MLTRAGDVPTYAGRAVTSLESRQAWEPVPPLTACADVLRAEQQP